MIAHVFLCDLCELREGLRLHFVRLCPRYAAKSAGGLGEQGARATRFCPRMTASVRIWPQEFAKTSSALGGQERFLSAVGQRGSCPTAARSAPWCSTVGYSASSARDTAAANAVGGGLFQGFASATSISAGFAKKRCLELSSLNKCWSSSA